MALRRGFKSEANSYAREMRSELCIPLHGPICPWQLAKHLGFVVVKLSDYATIEANAVAYLQSALGQKEFSAITLCDRKTRWIIHNDAHHRYRQAANISHELAHGLLIHPPTPLKNVSGGRTLNRDQEEEAHWLGPALLISQEAALSIAEEGRPHSVDCDMYGVSNELLQMRLRVTGALIRVARRRAA